MCNEREPEKQRIDPSEIHVCGLDIHDISTFATAVKSFHGYTDDELYLADQLRKAIDKACSYKHNKINAKTYPFFGTKAHEHIKVKLEVLYMMMAYAYREIQFEREAWKHFAEEYWRGGDVDKL